MTASDGGLLRLVEAERLLAQTLASVEQEAAAIVRAAQDEATAEYARLDQRIAAEVADLTARIAGERDAEIARMTTDAERYGRALAELSDDTIDALAAEMEVQLLTLDTPEPAR